MAIGGERSLLVKHPLKRAIVRSLGDTHYGRVLRFLYLRQALGELAIHPTSILDAGCGKGYLSLYLAKRYPNARIMAMDLGEADLVEAERIRQLAAVENLVFVRGDLQRPVRPGAFDLIVSSEVLEYVDDQAAALRHLRAGLRPGGVLLLHLMHAEGGYRRMGLRHLFARDVAEWRDVGMVRAGYTAHELEAQLCGAGFTDIQLQPTFGYVGMFAHTLFEAGRSWPTPLYLALFPLLVALAHADTRLPKTSGGAILALART